RLRAGAGGGPAPAAKPGGVTERSPSAVLDFAAGEPCAFPIHVEPAEDSVTVTTWPEKPNGDVLQIYSGHLVAIVTNVMSGKTLRYENGGSIHVVFHGDG